MACHFDKFHAYLKDVKGQKIRKPAARLLPGRAVLRGGLPHASARDPREAKHLLPVSSFQTT